MSISVSTLRRDPYARVVGDFYGEPRWLVNALLDAEPFTGTVLDPCCGSGTIPSCCLSRGLEAIGADIAFRGYRHTEVQDFFDRREPVESILCNPPYLLAQRFVEHGLTLAPKVAVLVRMAFLESQARKSWFEASPLARVWVSSRRASIPPGISDGERDLWGAVIQPPATGGSMPYAWLVWQRGHRGKPEIGWI